jgi:hypothetical protein
MIGKKYISLVVSYLFFMVLTRTSGASSDPVSIQYLLEDKFPLFTATAKSVYANHNLTDEQVSAFCNGLRRLDLKGGYDRITSIDLTKQEKITSKAFSEIIECERLRSVFNFELSGTGLQTKEILKKMLESNNLGSLRDHKQISSTFGIPSSEVYVHLDEYSYKSLKKELKEKPIMVRYHTSVDDYFKAGEKYEKEKEVEISDITQLYRFNFEITYKGKEQTEKQGMKWIVFLVEGLLVNE